MLGVAGVLLGCCWGVAVCLVCDSVVLETFVFRRTVVCSLSISASNPPFFSGAAFDLTHNVCDSDKLDEAGTLLRIFQLRRLKVEVEKLMPTKHEMKLIVKLSDDQKFWAKRLLARDARMLASIEADLQGMSSVKSQKKSAEGMEEVEEVDETNNAWKRMNGLLMQLRKVCNHPYLLPGADPAALNAAGEVSGTDESIVTASGKMIMLDRLLERKCGKELTVWEKNGPNFYINSLVNFVFSFLSFLCFFFSFFSVNLSGLFKNNHRVVLFSQFTSMLDIFEDYLNLRGYRYVRLDGSSSRTKRTLDLRVFNAEGSEVFIFLMSTRAGGLGINAQTADTVILYDSDWNPQVDQQAMARVHRIGQKKKVHIYRLITGDSVEERIITRAEKKLFMDKMVNRDSTRMAMEFEKLGKKEMLKMLKFGAHAVFGGSSASSSTSSAVGDVDVALDDIDIGISLTDLDLIVDRTKDWKAPINDASDFNAEEVPLNIRDMLADEMDGKLWGGSGECLFVVCRVSDLFIFFSCFFLFLLVSSCFSCFYSSSTFSSFLGKQKTMRDIKNEWMDIQTTKRSRTNRIINVDGHNVLRENNYTMSEAIHTISGNKSKTPRNGRKTKNSSSSSSSKRAPKPKKFEHDSWCLICWDGGDMLCCDRCPASFHEHCLEAHGYLGRAKSGIVKDGFVCPQHMCRSCGRRPTAAGGVLIACKLP